MVTVSVVQHDVVRLQINLQKVFALELGESIRELEHQISQQLLRHAFATRGY